MSAPDPDLLKAVRPGRPGAPVRSRRLYLSLCHAYDVLGPHARSALREAVEPDSTLDTVVAAGQLIAGTTDAESLALVLARLISMSNETAASVGMSTGGSCGHGVAST